MCDTLLPLWESGLGLHGGLSCCRNAAPLANRVAHQNTIWEMFPLIKMNLFCQSHFLHLFYSTVKTTSCTVPPEGCKGFIHTWTHIHSRVHDKENNWLSLTQGEQLFLSWCRGRGSLRDGEIEERSGGVLHPLRVYSFCALSSFIGQSHPRCRLLQALDIFTLTCSHNRVHIISRRRTHDSIVIREAQHVITTLFSVLAY